MGFILKSVNIVLTILAAVVVRDQAAPLTVAVPPTSPCGLDHPSTPLADRLKSLLTEANYAADACRAIIDRLNGTALTLSEAQTATGKDAQSEMKLPKRVTVADSPVASAAGEDHVVMNATVLKQYYEDLSVYLLLMRRETASANGGGHGAEMERAQNAVRSVVCKVDSIFKTMGEPGVTPIRPALDGGSVSTDEKTQAKKMFAIVYGARCYLQDLALNFLTVASRA